MAEITFDNVSKTYGDGFRAVSDLEPRRAGRRVRRLRRPVGLRQDDRAAHDRGSRGDHATATIRIGERVVNNLPPRDRDVAMVFQNYALYPHMTVAENIGFALRMRKVPKAEARKRIEETARIIGLVDHLDRKPRQLSGGQRQRVAMGRAIVREPQVFLMDEPLSNLDAKLRVQMRAEISRIQRQLRRHDRLRDARPGRGDDDGRPRRRAAARRAAAVRRAAAPVRAAGEPVRRELHRQPRDEHARGDARTRRATASSCRVGSATLPLPPEVLSAAGARELRRASDRARHPAGGARRVRRRTATAASCAASSARSRRSARSSSRTSRSRRSPCSSRTCSRASSTRRRPRISPRSRPTATAPRGRSLVARLDASARVRAGGADRARGRPPQAHCMSSTSKAERRDRCLSSLRHPDDAVTCSTARRSSSAIERGDLDGIAAASGFFAADTRFLSRLVLTVDGERGEPVSLEQAAPHLASFELRASPGLAVRRELFVGRGLEETITVENRSDARDRDRGGARARLRLRRHLRRQARRRTSARSGAAVDPSRPEQWDDATTLDVRRRRVPRAHARALSRRRRTSRTAAPPATGFGSRPARAGGCSSRCSGC